MKLLSILLLFFSLSSLAETVKIHVPDMVCQACVQSMKKHFKNVVKDQDKDITVNLETKMVTLNTSKPITDEEVNKRVEEAGYEVKKVLRESK